MCRWQNQDPRATNNMKNGGHEILNEGVKY